MVAYKIKNLLSGEFIAGTRPMGSYWTNRGRVWGSRSAFVVSLRYWLQPRYGVEARSAFPAYWAVVELSNAGITVTNLNDWFNTWYPTNQGAKRTRAPKVPQMPLDERNRIAWHGLANLYRMITGKECPDEVGLGMATSAVQQLIEERDWWKNVAAAAMPAPGSDECLMRT